MTQGATVLAAILALAYVFPRRPRIAGVLALVCVAADLATANAKLIWTVPQAVFDAPSRAAQLIETAERSDPSPGPFRIHRMTGWYPTRFIATRTPRRLSELSTWSHETLYPLIGLPLGLEYGMTIGSLEIEDYVTFFQPRMMPMPDGIARALGVPAGQPLAYFPRRSFDVWGVRYFLLPATPEWGSNLRGFASFLDQTELIYPSSEVLHEEPTPGRGEPWSVSQDWQLRRNKAAYPRAWIVHSARVRSPARDPATRGEMMRTLAFMNDPIWSGPDRPVLDLRQTALIEVDDKEGLKGALSSTPVGPSESVTVVEHGPQRVVLRAALERPGLVILADTYYPGWHLTIDGESAPIYRANRMMRGAAVPRGSAHAGVHLSAGIVPHRRDDLHSDPLWLDGLRLVVSSRAIGTSLAAEVIRRADRRLSQGSPPTNPPVGGGSVRRSELSAVSRRGSRPGAWGPRLPRADGIRCPRRGPDSSFDGPTAT